MSMIHFIRELEMATTVQIRVIGALLLRDLRARMAGSAWNYAKFIAVPLFHLLSLSITYAIIGRRVLLGTDQIVFFVSGILPFILFLYPIRSNIHVLEENRPLLVFPIINPIDIVLARILLEAINSLAIIGILATMLYLAGIDVMPKNIFKTVTGIAATIGLAVSFCIPNAIIARLIANWQQACVLTAIGLYIISGAFFLPSQMPESIRTAMYFNPLAHCVEWIRSGYYETYKEGLLDRGFLGSSILGLTALGLVLERYLRGKLN